MTTADICGCCGSGSERILADHCHQHGQQRGPLCHRCNMLMAWIDRRMVPRVSPPVTVAGLIAHAARCPECPQISAGDLKPGRRIRRTAAAGGKYNLHLRIGDDLAAAIEAYAAAYGISVANAVRILLRQALNKENENVARIPGR